MLTTIALLFLFSLILAFFSQEFLRLFKKVFAIKGMKLFLPLFVVTYVIIIYEIEIQEILKWFQHKLNLLFLYFNQLLGAHFYTFAMVKIVFLTILACIGLIISSVISPRYHVWRRLELKDSIVFGIWLCFAVLMVIPPHM